MTRRTGMVMPMSFALFLHEMFRHSDMIEASTPTLCFNLIVTDGTGDGVGHTAAGPVINLCVLTSRVHDLYCSAATHRSPW